MKIGAWNVGHQIGRHTFRPETAHAVLGLACDVVVLSEYCPGESHAGFVEALRKGGMRFHEVLMADKTNGIFIGSREPLKRLDVRPPELDRHSSVAALAVRPKFGPCILGFRVPWWTGEEEKFVSPYWDWIEETAEWMRKQGTSVLIGDMNVRLSSKAARGGDHFRRLLSEHWVRAEPRGTSLAGHPDGHQIDHALFTKDCSFGELELIQEYDGLRLCGKTPALSDHAALVVSFDYPGEPSNSYLYEDEKPPTAQETELQRERLRSLGLTEEQILRIT
jgi:hypothetical protein